MSNDMRAEINNLHADVAHLKARVAALELAARATDATADAPAPAQRPRAGAYEPAVRPAPPAHAPQQRPVTAAAPSPPPRIAPRHVARVEWRTVGEQVFTARTLAWAGGVATTLGIVLLFVLAASRGWVTPPMRVAIGVAVSLGLLAAAVELDRRKWRADSILAAAGSGIAGLYACLWASTSLYDWFQAPAALPLAALVAGLAVTVAIRIRQEPLAVFGVCAAMIAPVLVSVDITAGGVLFAAIMAAAVLPLHRRFGWEWLMRGAWGVAFAETVALLVAERHHHGAGLAVVDAAVVTALFVAMLFQLELPRSDRSRVSGLGWLVASSAFTVSMGGTLVFGGERMFHGVSVAGLTLLGVTAMWTLLAAAPSLAGRRHAELTDLLAGFGLATAATATGLLAGGGGLVCAWAAEAAVLVAVAERVAGRDPRRRGRIVAAAGVYYGLALVQAVHLTWPTDFRLTALGAGSQQGTIALLAIAAAGIVYCYGTRWIRAKETVALWAIPALALAYLPLWALSGDRVVMAEAALAAALFGYRRTRHLVSWLPEGAAALIACGFWATGAVVAIASSAPLDSFGDLEWAAFGGREGLAGLASLVGAAAVLAWSVRTPARPHAQYALLLPFATLAYLIAEAVTAPHAFWAWLAVAAVAAACVHVPDVRRRLGEEALQASAVMMFSLGVAGGWAADDSLRAFVEHGRSSGWETILLAALAGLVVASSFRDLRLRSYALWAPFGLLAQLSAMLLPGQYAVVAWAALSSLAGLLVCLPPRPLRGRLDLAVVRELSVLSAAGVATVVLFGYERPDMLFQSNRTPASGLAAAAAATVALFLAAAAARRPLRGETVWTISGMRVWSALVYAAGAAALWTLSAAILGAVQFTMPSGASSVAVHDRFQNGHVLVSISWALVGLALVVVSLRGERRRLRVGGIALLFVALGKLFLYDLAYLDAMARAISFIVSGAVLLLAALLLQRFAPHVKAALVDEDASTTA